MSGKGQGLSLRKAQKGGQKKGRKRAWAEKVSDTMKGTGSGSG